MYETTSKPTECNADHPTRFDSKRGRTAAYRKHSMYDSRQTTSKARRSFLDRFERQIEQEATERGERIGPRELARRAECRKRAYFQELAAKSTEARRK